MISKITSCRICGNTQLVPVIDRQDSDKPEGQVLKVEDEGEQVDPGTKITVTVSRGNLKEVPNVIGQSLDAATAVLNDRGFTNIETVDRSILLPGSYPTA